MPLTHLTDRHAIRLLATETRRTDTSPRELAAAHKDLGTILAVELIEFLELEPSEIAHPQGIRQGWRLRAEDEIAVLTFMRAGFYVAEGVRAMLHRAPLLHVSPTRNVGLSDQDLLALKTLGVSKAVIADSVVNTGASLEPVLTQLGGLGLRVFVLSLVCPVDTAHRLAVEWPEVEFLFARVSDNKYVGKGATDTGNRLFGTTQLT